MTSNKLFEGIEIFVQVVKSQGFSAAAEQLGHSSSHVSKEITKLETRLGVRLLNRTTRSIALTPEGEAYYQYCTQLLQDAESAIAAITQNSIDPKGTLKVSCPIGFSAHYLQPILAQFLDLYPNVRLDLDLSDKHIDVIADGYDLAIRATPQLAESSLICKRIFKTKAYVIASKGYLEKQGRPYHPRELNKHHCICYSNLKNPTRWEFSSQSGEHFSVDVKEKMRCNNGQAELDMVLADQGICRLPGFYLDSAFANEQIEALFPEFIQPEVNVYAVYPSRKHLSPKVRCFIDLLSEALTEN
ncbi:LysR family transcriptional regulator [Motilimonas sp. E26]|uniref:LysR family transcriptional regulator n=1 Tax=Motilimonas sp. E26 TaxID=2865674 RepID=UPI001E34A495|nr:LysR family transcriptional regulator [Motilimonas sp. E26]MCE0557028.1 LysR family transcriptional regulator [Motilimonas sp. E26]